jgi:hypothetical protein
MLGGRRQSDKEDDDDESSIQTFAISPNQGLASDAGSIGRGAVALNFGAPTRSGRTHRRANDIMLRESPARIIDPGSFGGPCRASNLPQGLMAFAFFAPGRANIVRSLLS